MKAKEVWVEPNETVTRGECKGKATNPKDNNRDGEASQASGEHCRHIFASDRACLNQQQTKIQEDHKKATHHCEGRLLKLTHYNF